jgi:hypothetical protein
LAPASSIVWVDTARKSEDEKLARRCSLPRMFFWAVVSDSTEEAVELFTSREACPL